jgi:hypothetical protein
METQAQKFTPGPWYISEASVDDYSKGGIVVGTDTLNICVMSDADGSDESQKADARLIAAAPELFEALERLLYRFNAHTPDKTYEDLDLVLTAERVLAKVKPPKPPEPINRCERKERGI